MNYSSLRSSPLVLPRRVCQCYLPSAPSSREILPGRWRVAGTLTSLPRRIRATFRASIPSLGKHLCSTAIEIVFHQFRYRLGDLLSPLRRGFDRVGVVSFLHTDKPQVE